MADLMQVPQGQFRLTRYPELEREQLRAWDAADEYLLNHISENFSASDCLNVLVVNDSFGSLAVALLRHHKVTLWSDSYLTEQGVLKNLAANNITDNDFSFIPSTETPEEKFDLVLYKVPKSHAYLEDQLCRLNSVLDSNCHFISAGMAKNIHSSTLDIFEKYLGETKTSRAVKKARLIFSKIEKKSCKTKYPKCYQFEGFDYDISNYSNVFSRDKLDIGTRFFLQHLPASEKYQTIIDMGCGNGLLGLSVADKNPQASVTFVDESFMAVRSAEDNLLSSGLKNKAVFETMDCLEKCTSNSADLIINNPPFHQQHATGDAVAWRMFNDAKRVLKTSCELLIVGNRHLSYHVKLKKIFNNCEQIASNKKFVVLRSVKK